jgi:hypothetical protein
MLVIRNIEKNKGREERKYCSEGDKYGQQNEERLTENATF